MSDKFLIASFLTIPRMHRYCDGTQEDQHANKLQEDLQENVAELQQQQDDLHETVRMLQRQQEELQESVATLQRQQADLLDSVAALEGQRRGVNKRTMKLDRAFGGFEYMVAPTRMSWNDHERMATAWGGHVASITGRKESRFVRSLLPQESFWTGLVREGPGCEIWEMETRRCGLGDANHWRWSDGSKYTFRNWDVTQPETKNETNVVDVYDADGGDYLNWHDLESTHLFPAVYKRLPRFGGFEYTVADARMTWQDHESKAIRWGGHITSITSAEEQRFVRTLVVSTSGTFVNIKEMFWIGLVRKAPGRGGTEKHWKWSDGSKFDFTNWHSSQPDDKNETMVTDSTGFDEHHEDWHDWHDCPEFPAVYKRPI
jgi:hypothetical protein